MSRRVDPSLIPHRPNLAFERALWKQGIERVAGLDEAGRGALAGPVFAAAVVLPSKGYVMNRLRGVRDSKEMTASEREKWAAKIEMVALGWGIGAAGAKEIDAYGIVPATRLGMQRALAQIEEEAGHLLIDALVLPEMATPQSKLLKGDQRSLSIAAASVLAKVARDAALKALDSKYPGYGLGQHKGYGTKLHRGLIRQLGPSRIHRHSFRLSAADGD